MSRKAQYPYEKYNLYLVHHKKMNRMMACLVNPLDRKDRKTISYARYKMAIHLKRELTPDETVDHIDENKMNDEIDNLRILSRLENQMSYVRNRQVKKICPVCSKEFYIGKAHRLSFKSNSCSNVCKYIYMSNKFKNK